MKYMKHIVVIFLCCVVLGACGRMSNPQSPEGAVYPRTYIIQD